MYWLEGKRQYVDRALYFNPAALVRAPQFAFGNANQDALIEKVRPEGG